MVNELQGLVPPQRSLGIVLRQIGLLDSCIDHLDRHSASLHDGVYDEVLDRYVNLRDFLKREADEYRNEMD